MTKQNRAELKALRRAEKKIIRDALRAARARDAALNKAQRDYQLANNRAERAVDRELNSIIRRIAILEGRGA